MSVAYGLWIAMLLSWFAASFWVSRAKRRGLAGLSLAHLFGFWLGFSLLFSLPADQSIFGAREAILTNLAPIPLRTPLWTLSPAIGWLLVLAEIAAFTFGWWARAHIGELWSGYMTVREGHRVVDTGPYRLVRHPIYTAFIAAAWVLAILAATPTAFAGALVLTAVMAVKARQEEDFLRRELGAAAYDAYAARTPMLIPFLRPPPS